MKKYRNLKFIIYICIHINPHVLTLIFNCKFKNKINLSIYIYYIYTTESKRFQKQRMDFEIYDECAYLWSLSWERFWNTRVLFKTPSSTSISESEYSEDASYSSLVLKEKSSSSILGSSSILKDPSDSVVKHSLSFIFESKVSLQRKFIR